MVYRLAFALTLLCTSAAAGDTACPVEQLAIDAALGDRQAQYNLAVEFWRGESVARDLSKSAVLWRLASEQGDVDAASNLGFLLFNGQGVERDQQEAIRLWTRAASGGQPEAHLHLSRAYSSGDALAADEVEAYARALAAGLVARRSTEKAAQAVAKDADAQIEAIRPKLTTQQTQQAEQRGRKYADPDD